jgi:RNA polymerase sigma-70 factor, ECF subfamily
VTTSRGAANIDEQSRSWVASLAHDAPDREATVARLHALLLRASRAELNRRADRVRISGPELDDLAHQSADDAVVSICRKVHEFRGASRFTTWAYKFAILEVSSKLGRHFWLRPELRLDAARWELLPDRLGVSPELAAQSADLFSEVRRIVTEELTEWQRRVFVAIVVDAIPLDALVLKLDSNRNAIYKTMFDARRKIRQTLAANGYLDTGQARRR